VRNTPASLPDSPGCREREEALSRYLDGELDTEARGELERHLQGCEGCQKALAQLQAVKGALGDLGPLSPPPALFDSVAAAVDRRRRRLVWGATLGFAAVGTAALVALLVAGRPAPPPVAPTVHAPLSVRASAEAEFQKAERHYRNAIRMLRSLADREKPLWSWKRRRAYEADLRVLDSAIEQSRELVRRAPADGALQELVFAAYRAEIDYLRDVLSPRVDDTI
jgi:hypothetical protein